MLQTDRATILKQIAKVLIGLSSGLAGGFWLDDEVETSAHGADEAERFDADEALFAAGIR